MSSKCLNAQPHDRRKELKIDVLKIASAENELEDLTIKHLTHGNPTMTQKFEDLKSK